jgi:hypothetical protein
MLERCPHPARHPNAATAVRGGVCDRFLFGLALLTLVRAADAPAGELAAQGVAVRPEPQVRTQGTGTSAFSGYLFTKQPLTSRSLSDPLLMAPGAYGLPRSYSLDEAPTFADKEFRPRGRSMFDADAGGLEQGLSFNQSTWQRLNEYRTRDKVRVLTLWESGASALSLQTNHKGDPSLQWTSRLMNRGGATHGILDQLFPTSIFGGATRVTRSPTSQPSRISGAFSALHFGGSTPP